MARAAYVAPGEFELDAGGGGGDAEVQSQAWRGAGQQFLQRDRRAGPVDGEDRVHDVVVWKLAASRRGNLRDQLGGGIARHAREGVKAGKQYRRTRRCHGTLDAAQALTPASAMISSTASVGNRRPSRTSASSPGRRAATRGLPSTLAMMRSPSMSRIQATA